MTNRVVLAYSGGLDTSVAIPYLAEMTDGGFRIQPFAAGELVPGLQALDAVNARYGRGEGSPGKRRVRSRRAPGPRLSAGLALTAGLRLRGRSRMQAELLHPPVQQLGHEQRVLRGAGDLVYPAELPRPLASPAQHAKHLAV